ncbi:MAG: Cna B-type domain-containing protein [Clostridiales bacterium]|nr:Cna B-type domain-containing protein [Clostridiales bacterium]
MNHLKRVMAWVMTAAMLVSSCPTTAIADEVVSQVQKPVAQTLRSGETYGSLKEAYKAEFETTTDETHMSFEDRVRDVEKNGKDTLIYANLRPAQNAAQWKTGEVVPFTLSMTFQLATNLTEYRAFDLNSMTFDEYIRYRPFDSYDDIKLQISAPGNLRISATDNGGWTNTLNVDSVQSVVPADGSNAVTLNYTFFGRMIDNGVHADGDPITPTVSLSASITPKMHYYDENGEEKVYAGTPIGYRATIHTNAFRNAAKAKTWDVQNEAVMYTVNGDEVTFTYQVRTGALGTQGEILRQNSDYVDKGVLDLSGYTLKETIQPVKGKNGAKVYPKQATVTLGDSAYTCGIVENGDGTRSLVMPAKEGNTIHNTAALDGDNTAHPSVYAYNNYTVNLIYDRADFELDCDDERLDDAAFKGLGVTLDSTLNYTVYGDSDEKTADSSETLYYHFVRQGGYILPEQYVKLAADVADRTAYSGSDAAFAIYKASEVTRNEKGELVLGENAKLSDRIGAFKTSRELPEGDYYVVRTGMEAGYTNVKPGDKKTIKIGEAFYPYQLVTVKAGTKENAVKAEFEDYNAQNGQFILEKMFYAPDGTQNTNSSLSAEFTLKAKNGRTYTVKVKNGEPTTVYLPADTYTMKETGVSEGFAKAAGRIVDIKAGSQTRMTGEDAVKNYSTEGLLNLKAYLRKYERGDNLEVDQSHYTVTITRDGETEPVKQTTLDEAESVYLPRFDGDGNLITYRVKVESNEQTDGLFYASSKNGEEEKPEEEIQITFTDDARIQNADYFFIKQQELTITKRLVDVSGLNKEQTWMITVQAACEAGDALPSRTVELTTDGKQNEASQTLSLRGWDENGHVVTYTVVEAAAEGYAVTYSEKSVTLDDGTDKTITVTNTRQVGKTTFTKEGSDNVILPDAVYAVLTQKADGTTYLVERTLTDGVLTEKTAAIVDEAGRLTQPENVAEAYRFTTDADGRIELVLPVEEGTSYYLQELAAPENYYLNTELVWLTVAAGDDSQKAGQVDQRKYQLEVTKDFPDEVANGSFATFTLYDETMRQVGEPVTVRKPDQAVGVFTIPAYGKYFVRETAVSGDMMLNDSVFGPLTYSETNRADNPTVPNKANVGSLTVELRDEKKEKLGTQPAAIDYVNAADLAKFTVSVGASNLAEDSYAYRALLKTGFVLDETTNTLVYTGEKGESQAFELSSLPIYGDPNDKTTALTYTVKQEQAAQRYFKAEDEQQFKLDENASQTLTFENEPKAALNVSLNYQKEYELERGNAPEYPLTGATMTLYEVKDDGTLEQVESFNMTNPTATISDLHGLKHYVLVETKVPDGYCAYAKNSDHPHSDNAAYNREPHDYQDVLKNFNYVELTGKETDNQNDSQSSITNYKDYVQLKLNKSGYTVQFADGAATEGVVVGETQPLDYCQFEVYAIRTSDLTEKQRELLDRNSAFEAPKAEDTVEKGKYTGREAELEAIFTAEPQKSKLITDGITYETGASGMGTGAFMTDAFELDDDVGEYTFLFREVKINHAGGYQKVYGGVWSAAATEVNAVTEVNAYNEADVLSGGETEFKGLFQVKLDKEYWPSTEAKDNNRVGELKPLAGVTFELLLARENANGLLEAVKGRGAFSTEFVTGCESGMSAGYGVSITVSLETLYTENGGADNPDNPVKLDKDENGQPFYEADFILREKDYPINMVYMQERYALHVKAVKNAQGADYVTVVDDYLNKDGKHNAIKNILGEMTYLTVAKYVDGERYYGGEGSTDAVYTITDAKGKVYTHVTLNNANHYETTVQLPRQTTFTIEETTAPVIEGVQTDKSGFVFDGGNVNGTSANRLTFTTGEYKSQIAVCSTNTRFHSLTVIKLDADEKLVKGAPIQIGYSDGKSAVLSSNGSALANTRQTTNEKGEVIFSLPIWDYRTSEAGNYPKAKYAIAEALDETPVAANWNPNAVVNRYFKLLNGGKLTIAGADVQADKPITVYNPATTSVTLHKVSDRSGDTADLKPIAAYFALYFCPFKSQDEFEGKSNYPQIGYVYLPCTGTTDAETGEITFDGLYSGWYKLVETIPQGQVNAGQLFTTWFRVICEKDYKHLDKSGKSKSYTSEVQLLASATLKNRSDAGRQDANNSVTITDHTIDVTNTPRAYLEITKTFEPSQTQSIPKSVAFYVYKQGTTEAAELEMRVVDAHGTESWQKVTQQPITLGGFTETKRSQSIVVRLDPGEYTVVESTDESAGYWFAKSAAYRNDGNPETPVYNGTTVANGRIISSRDVTVTRYNAMDAQRQMKVDFVNAGTLMAGQIEKTKRLSESETPTALENCFFSLYTRDKQNNKRYYAGRESDTPFGDWTGARENAARFKSGADGMAQLNEVYAPEDAMTDGVRYTYYVEEISAPNYSYQLAYDAKIDDLAAGSVADTISMVNTRGVSIQVRVFGSVSDNRDDDTPVVEGAVLHIMKKDAEGKLHEVLLSDEQPYLYQTVTSDANGDVLFPYLPRLEEGEAYVVFEQPDAGAIGDDSDKPYLNPVSRGYKAYYDFKKTDANHSMDEQDVSELDGAAGYYTVVTGEELMANPNELFSTLHFNAYNEPKGRLVILKRDYENKSALVGGAKFSAAETDGTDETHSYAFANLEPIAADRTEAPQTLEIGEKTYTLAKDRTYYTDERGYRYTYVITSYVERGKYAFAETTTPAGYIETEALQSAGMPWHTEAEAELTNEGGFAAAAFANIPNRDPYLDKTVSAVNGEAGGKLGNLQNTQADGSWQTVTFEIRKTTSDSGAADANDAIRYPMNSFVITDNKVEYQTVDAHGNKSGWLDGGEETVQTQHFVEGVTVGKMSFAQLEEAYGTAAEGDRIYADVYGMIGTQETLIRSNIDVTGSDADVSLKAEDGDCIYTGFKIAYHMKDSRDIPAGLRQDTPIAVTMRFHQESGEAIDRVCGVRNTAGLKLAYAIGAKSQASVSKTYTDAANCDADSSIGLPKAKITKQVQRAEIVQNPNTGDYVVTVEAEATNPKSDSLTVSAGSGAHYTIVFENISGQAENLPAIEAPILVDTLPRQAMAVKAEATSDNAALKLTTTVSQDGYTVVVRGDGQLEAGQKITLTVDALFVGERILEQIIAHNTGMDANIAYAMSGVQTVKNTKNPFGVPFVDEAGNEITGMVKQQPGDSQSGELPGFEGQHGISAKAEHRSAEPSALTISKYVAGTITGKNKFVSGSNVAVTGAKTEKDNEINRIYYRILVENPSLSPAANVAVMDELPHTDDWRNDSSTRDSKWDVALESTAISVTKYAADGSSTELKPGEDYTVYFTKEKITSQNRNTYNDYFGADNIRNSWATSMAPADVHGFAVMLTQPLAGKERVLIEYTCSAPEVTDSSVYFTTANNIARLSYDQHSGVASDVTRVAIIPEKVWLGNRVWIDFNGDGIQSKDLSVEPNYAYTGEGKQLTMQLSQRYNRYRPTTQTQTITDGSYQFNELFAAVKLASLKNDPNDSDGNVVATNLSGSERYTYQLTLSGIPKSFMVTRKSVNNPIASDEDSDFVADGNGSAATKWFYLPVPTEEMVKNNQLGYPQVDVGLVPVRDLEITKKADNDADVSDAVFAIYGPYTTEELGNLTAVSAAKKVGKMTSSGNVYSFVSTQSAYLTYADSYLVVETSAPAPYLSTGATFSGEGIAAHGEVEIGGEKHSCFVLEGMNTLPGDFKADSRKTYCVNATDLYSAAGTYMLTAQKKVFAKGTQVELERYANLFRIWVTSPDDPNLTKRVAAGGNVTVEENAVFVQADENGKFDLTMNYATIPETGWTQRDWEGMTYTYQIEEVDTAFDGVTYDKTKYTVTVTLEDDGQGHLTPKAEISGGEDGSIVLKNELARRNLTISKTTTGNKVLSDDAFTVKIVLSRKDIVPVDGDYPMDGAAETKLTVKNGEATLKIRDGQTVTIKDIPVGTTYTVEETDERAQGYNIDASAYTSGGSGVIATDKEAKVELKNVRNVGSLEIRKKIEGKDPISEREFSFTAAITYPDGVNLEDEDNLPKNPVGSQRTVKDRTVTIKDIRIAVSQTKPDVNVTIGNILYGASYTVTENDGFAEWGYAAYYDEDMKFGESTLNRVVNAENQTALFTNVRSAGKLKIGKTATGTGVGKGLAAGTETYNVNLTLENKTVSLEGHVGRSNMPSEGEKTTYPVKQEQVGQEVTLRLNLHNGEVVTFDDLPEGTSYTVVEDEQPYRDMGFTVSYADGNSSTTEKNKGKISKETASSVQITNVRDTHSVSITKNVLGQMANEDDAFDFNVRIEKKDDALSDEAVYRAYTYTVNGRTETIDFRRRDVQTISLKKGETAVIDDVPDGADIIVKEAMSEKHEDEGYTLKTTQTEKNEKPNIIGYTFTNERYIGSIEITKALAGTGSDKGYGKTFTFDVKLWNEHNLDLLNAQTSTMPSGVDGLTKTNEQRDGHDVYAGTVSITMGADGQPVSASITNIPAHTHYEIVEHDYTDDGYTTQTPQNAFGIIDVVNEAGHEAAMTFTNTRESGTLALSKVLKGNATDGEKAFTFHVKLENARFDTATQRDAYDVVIREANKADVQTTVARDANGEYVLTLKGGQTATLLDVLYGTTATVAEDDYTAEGYEAVSTQTATVNGQTPDAAVAFTNERNVGVLSVTKNAVGNAVKFEKNGRAVFSFSATLTYADWIDLTQTNNLPTVDGKTPKNMTVDAKNHTVTLSLSIPVTEAARVGSLNVENILKGTRYAVREVFDAQDGYYLTVSTQNGRVNGSEVTGTIADALTGDAVFANTRNVGALEITKKLEGTGYNDRVAVSNAVRTSFGFTVRLWREDGVRLTGDNRPTLNGKALTLETRTENGFTYDEAHVTVDMADGAAATGEERGVTIGNILVDTHYTVIEDENGYQTEGYVVRQGEQGGVMTDAGDMLRFVNTRDTGSLEIVKNLDGRTAEFGREFEFTVTLSRNDNIALAGTYLTQSGRTVAFEDNAAGGVTARVRVAGGGSLTILGIPSGTSYTVSEADYTADRYTTTSTGAVGVVETAAVRATFLNTRANPGYGALTVTKTVEAIGGAEIPDTQFVFDIALTLEDGEDFTGTLRTTRTSGETGRLYFNGGAASIRLSHGESVTLSGIPLGTSYTVTERAAQDMRVSSTGSEGAIKGTGHMAAFVNTMTQAYTDLIVRKAWNDANDAQKLRPQSVTVDVTRNGQTITTLTLNAANRWTQTLTQLPMFDDNGEAYDYDVVENDVPEGYTASVVTRGTTFTVINTHRIDDGFVPVDPENRRRGGLTILDDLGVPLGGGINMNEGDCFN